ncbi:MAG TPA: T9SS type A sorting domain-containing protein, partial [bacterium]|nr:T9SS type A sorting domain-containing protein [bacterium]
LPLPIQCDSPLRGLQLQLCYDTKLIDIGAPKLTDRTKNMSLDFQKSEGSIDVLLFNFDKDFIAAGSGPVITVPVVIKSQSFESSMIKIENVILAGVNCQPVAATGIEDISVSINDLSMDYSLAQNYPNPFNAETEIQYYIPITAKVNLTIYNLLGEEIITLVDQKLQAGSHRVHWDGRDKKGFNLPTGIYLYRIQSENYTKTRKLALMK